MRMIRWIVYCSFAGLLTSWTSGESVFQHRTLRTAVLRQ